MRVFLGMQDKSLGDVLKAYRKANHLTQKKVADYLDIDRTTYAKYETTRKPEMEVILKLSALYQISLDDFLKNFFSESEEFKKNPVVSVSAPTEKEAVQVNAQEMRLLSLFRDSLRKEEIMRTAEEIFYQDNEIIEEINNG